MNRIRYKVFAIVFAVLLIFSLGNIYTKTSFDDNKESVNSNKEPTYKESYSDEIYNKWLGVYEEKTLYQTLTDYLWLIVGIISIIILLILWNLTLKIKVAARTRELLQARWRNTRTENCRVVT